MSNLLNTIQNLKKESSLHSSSLRKLKDAAGDDFLFLFDLLAHSCGLESTLRVLTHSDNTFYDICKPKIDITDHLDLREDQLTIKWGPSDIERWLHSGAKRNSTNSVIAIDNYEVTIFPVESSNHSQIVPSMMSLTNTGSSESMQKDPEIGGTDMYDTTYFDLNGGKTEYIITIATIIGKSRMKGEKIVTNLVPYGAEKPRNGMVKNAKSNSVEIFWDPPKGEFTKYVLLIGTYVDI